MKYDFLILGAAGMQGKIVSRDLHEKGYKLILSDCTLSDKNNLAHQCKDLPYTPYDLEKKEGIVDFLKQTNADIVINCAEDDYIPLVLEACIRIGMHHLDLGSYMPDIGKIFAMDKMLKEKRLLAITGCGSVPGIGNVMLHHASQKLDSIHTIEVGFAWDSNIKKFVVPFSMEAIFYEFVHPAFIVENGAVVQKMPLETLKSRTFRGVGKQTIMLVNHSEPYTFYKYYKHKGVKNIRFYAGFPKHSFEKIMTMLELGFNGGWDKIIISDKPAYITDVVSALLKKAGKPERYTETENLWVDVYGMKDGKEKVIKMECIVPTLPGWEDAGCNVDTGLPVSIIAQMVKEGIITGSGCFAPEAIVPEEHFFAALRERDMLVYENGEVINEIVPETRTPPMNVIT